MQYTIQKLALLVGVSTRTLRYYDEIGILKPARINSSGYRIYGQAEVDRLQQIMFFKELGVALEVIQEIITSPYYDELKALREHREQLVNKKGKLDVLIINVEKTIASMEGRISMTDKEKFQGFKQQWLDDNEAKYGKEIRKKYGNNIVNKSNEKIKNMTNEEYQEVSCLAENILVKLEEAFVNGAPDSNIAQNVVELHKKWLEYYWGEYSKEAHVDLAQMYVNDERFKKYYDKQPGMTEFLRDAIYFYTGIEKNKC